MKSGFGLTRRNPPTSHLLEIGPAAAVTSVVFIVALTIGAAFVVVPSTATFGVFLSAAVLLAVVPGPGVLYVLARSLQSGSADGLKTTLGLTLGGLLHVVGAGIGLSSILARSATAFAIVKYLGVAYLVFLGLRNLRDRTDLAFLDIAEPEKHRPVLQGILVEALNPKTALFFLSFLPSFIDPTESAMLQFVTLGVVVVVLNSSTDIIVALFAGTLTKAIGRDSVLLSRQRQLTGGALVGLGIYVALSGE